MWTDQGKSRYTVNKVTLTKSINSLRDLSSGNGSAIYKQSSIASDLLITISMRNKTNDKYHEIQTNFK